MRQQMKPKELLLAFDQFLINRGLHFEAVVIGGAALGLLGVITRDTRDCDILDPVIPKDIEQSALEFAHLANKQGFELKEDCLNNGPISLKNVLPPHWKFNLKDLYQGKGLTLRTLGRGDLLKTKLFAFCDRGQDLQDCIALKPLQDELEEALEWVIYQDTNPDWPEHVKKQFAKLARKLGYGI